MDNLQLKETISGLVPSAEWKENTQVPEIMVSLENLHDTARKLRDTDGLKFDFLLSLTAVDWNTHFTMVYHLTSTEFQHTLVLKANIPDRDNAEADTVSDLWPTAEFHEREVFDLFGVKFRNHPDLRRIFLDDDWGFPLRKDYSDEINIIER